jgi:hypothetical protein
MVRIVATVVLWTLTLAMIGVVGFMMMLFGK